MKIIEIWLTFFYSVNLDQARVSLNKVILNVLHS